MISKSYIDQIVEGIPSQEYHGLKGTWSSSQLKKMNEDEELFHSLYIAGTSEKEESAAFDIGTHFHTAVLEPHLVAQECAVFKGVRRGKDWEKFKVDNAGKNIITESEFQTATSIIEAVRNSPVAMSYIQRGKPELSGFLKILVYRDEIFAPGFNLRMTKFGWAKNTIDVRPDRGTTLYLKARADSMGSDFILDLKSTTGNAKNPHLMKSNVSKYQYDLSAALYLDIFSALTQKDLKAFIWTFASKDYRNCRSYQATDENIQIGRVKWTRAVKKLAACIQSDWQFYDTLWMLEPAHFEREHLLQTDSDLL